MKSAKAKPASHYKVPNLERGLRMLELLLDHPNGLQQSDIAVRLGCAKTSVYRIALTLMEYGYLVRDGEKTLRLSRKLLAMGSRTLGDADLMTLAADVLKSLRDEVKETVLIGTIVETELVVLGQVLGSHPFKFSLDLGSRLPLHTAAPAKAILAWMPVAEQTALLGRISFPRFNERTLTSVKALNQDLERTCIDGYAVDRGEQLSGIHCVAAPVFDRHGYPIASIWTTGPVDRIRTEDLPAIGKLVVGKARIVSERLGFGFLARHGRKPTTGTGG